MKSSLENKLRISEIVVYTQNEKIPQKPVYEKFYVGKTAAVILSKIFLLKNAKKKLVNFIMLEIFEFYIMG